MDLGGIICDYDKLFAIAEAKRHLFTAGGQTELGQRIQKSLGRIAILADCAHALGATRDGKEFRIHKFRTMVANADQLGSAVTVSGDSRITPTGHFLRKYRLDELPQLIDILEGNMSFVGTRPEVTKYVMQYTMEMRATLLLPAGVTSEASILYKDEAQLLDQAEDVDRVYVEQVLPGKMKYNLESIRKFGLWRELRTMVRTVGAVMK